MKTKNFMKYTALLVAFMLVFTGCKKDPKLVADPNSYNSSNFPATLAQLKSVLGGVYAELRSEKMWGFDLHAHVIYSLDHTADLGYLGDPSWSSLTQNTYLPSNSYVSHVWSGAYTGIQRANTYLSALDYFRKNGAAASDSTELALQEGEVRFLRALDYFYLINLFGSASLQNGNAAAAEGVPLTTTTATTLSATRAGRSTARQVWDFIISELIIADQKLQKKTWDAANVGRVGGWAPKALLGKAYLFTGDYQKAKAVLKDVIDHSGKSLMPFDVYKNMFNGANEFNNESIFEINTQTDLSVQYGIFFTPNITTSAGLIYAPTCMNVSDTSAISNGYGNSFMHDKNLSRFGFNLPIWKMVLNPGYDASKPAGPFNLMYRCDPAYVAQSRQLRAGKTIDPRLQVSALQPWVDSIYTDSGNVTVKRVVLRCSNVPSGLQPQYYAWSLRKYSPIYKNIFSVKGTDNANFYILRLADIYLLYAEACAQTGESGTALEYINKVHRRAYGFNPDGASAADYSSLSAPTLASDPVLANQPLRYERWAELFAEGQWWFDVIRWRIGEQEAAYYRQTIPGPIRWAANSYYFPVPTTELDDNRNMQQTQGY